MCSMLNTQTLSFKLKKGQISEKHKQLKKGIEKYERGKILGKDGLSTDLIGDAGETA